MSTQPCGCDEEAGWTCRVHNGSQKQDVEPTSYSRQQIRMQTEAYLGSQYIIKDSGKRETFDGGMVRDTTEGKTDYLLLRDGPMFERWAEHLRKGALKYGKRNWTKAAGQAELERARESAARHFEQWLHGDIDEDHASAVIFNINEVEHVKLKLKEKS